MLNNIVDFKEVTSDEGFPDMMMVKMIGSKSEVN